MKHSRHATVWILCITLGLFASSGICRAEDDPELVKVAKGLNDATGDDVIADEILALLRKPDYAKKVINASAALAGQAESPLNFNGAYILGTVARELKDMDNSQAFFRLAIKLAGRIKSERKQVMCYLQLIDGLFENRKFEDAEKVAKEFMSLPGEAEMRGGKFLAGLRMVQIAAMLGRNEEAFRLLEPYVKAAAEEPEILKVHGWLLRHDGKYEEAAKVYEQFIAKIKNEEAKDRLRYFLSGLYSEAGNVDKAGEVLQDLLKKHPDNATYNNDLGYIWADHDKNLDEAEKMIRKAVDKDPKSAAYLDSLGWVLFKKKQYQEAKKFLLDAVKDPEGQHAEILEHLGDVHQALGEKAEAVAVWKRALDTVGTSKREQKRKEHIEKKIKENE